ncbi:MAG: NUDIX domain-containing protein [Anaerolineae bacterium]
MRHLVVPRTLCFVLDGDEVLLITRALHKRLFPGKVNGLGGHVEAGEDPAAAAAREIEEEAGIAVYDLWLAGVIHVDGALGQAEPLADGVWPGVLVLVYTAQAASRAVRASEEGTLAWTRLNAVDGLDWVDGDPRLLRLALAARQSGEPFSLYLSG